MGDWLLTNTAPFSNQRTLLFVVCREEALMAAKLQEGDTIAMQGEVTTVHDDGCVPVWLHGYSVPVTTRGEHLNLIAKRRGKQKQPAT